MESRKTNSADLERKRPVFFQLGLIIAISAALAAFEWKTPDNRNIILPPRTSLEPESEIIEIFAEKKPDIPKPLITTLLKEVDNKTKDLPDIEIKTEINPDDKIEPWKLPELIPENPDTGEPEIFVVAETMPEFPGGYAALMKYLSDNTKYPVAAREAGITGTVYITFVVETDGSISSIAVLRGVSGGCTEESLRVVSEMPRWNPGKQRGKPVRVSMNLPVKFMLLN
ncbi:MAG: TonB family protein [Lentimicrobium sp.]|nr:TonB family protein [Lentimicrobium sp.]